MKKITQEELNKIIRKHELWLRSKTVGERAVLCDVDLTGANLTGAILRDAILTGAILENADLSDANLSYAILTGAILENANLRGANLENADLSYANLRGANLENADLSYAILRGANLTGADLRGADLTGADLTGANLTGANLTGANLRGANLENASLTDANLKNAIDLSVPMACPTHGAFIGWKKCFREGEAYAAYIVKLQIPASAKRLSGTGRKCRTDKAKVLEIQTLQGKRLDDEYVCSNHRPDFQYRVGETVRPTERFCEDRWRECSSGIHFFIDREEAVRY